MQQTADVFVLVSRLQTDITGRVSGEAEGMLPVFLLSSEHVALVEHSLTSYCSIQLAALTVSPTHVTVNTLHAFSMYLLFLPLNNYIINTFKR